LLLPISLTQSHGYTPSAWGLFFMINPVLVAVLQIRLVRWTAGVSRHVKLTLACLLMGCGFLLVPAGASAVLVILVVVLFTFGEMLFGPSNQALLADISPSHARGTAMGLLSSTTSLSVALTPGLGLGLRAAQGDAAMWFAVAVTGAVAAVLYFWPVRRSARRGAATSSEA
jgi:sugar phosphate permease